MNRPTDTPSAQFHIVPAAPGWRCVYYFEGSEQLEACETIIAWRVETVEQKDDVESYAYAVTTGGEACSNVWGYLRPDGGVEGIGGGVFESIAEAIESLRPMAAARTANGQ